MSEMDKRIQELESILLANCEKYEDDCKTCPVYEQCEEWQKLMSKKSDLERGLKR